MAENDRPLLVARAIPLVRRGLLNSNASWSDGERPPDHELIESGISSTLTFLKDKHQAGIIFQQNVIEGNPDYVEGWEWLTPSIALEAAEQLRILNEQEAIAAGHGNAFGRLGNVLFKSSSSGD